MVSARGEGDSRVPGCRANPSIVRVLVCAGDAVVIQLICTLSVIFIVHHTIMKNIIANSVNVYHDLIFVFVLL